MTLSFHQRYKQILERVAEAAHAAGRRMEDIRIIGVSKRHSVEACRSALQAGMLDLGENYVQEWKEKAKVLAEEESSPRWHFIGGLQSNKARLLVRSDVLIHTVDRMSLAKALSKEAILLGKTARILIQVNEAGETQKAGVTPEQFEPLIEELLGLPGLQIQGLMCIPPARANPQDSVQDFRALRQRLEQLQQLDPRLKSAAELSMGMSSDFEWAIREGATLIRVGTALFGPRPS